MSFATIRSDFELLDDWEDRYRYIIELGRALPPMPEASKTDANKVRGCVSQVWLTSEAHRAAPGAPLTLSFSGDSDALIVRGLIAVLFALYEGRAAAEIASFDPMPDLAALGLKEHLTPQRSNGLASMVQRIRNDARTFLADERPSV